MLFVKFKCNWVMVYFSLLSSVFFWFTLKTLR